MKNQLQFQIHKQGNPQTMFFVPLLWEIYTSGDPDQNENHYVLFLMLWFGWNTCDMMQT